jgi:tetratricopeptide (TPR) repeat protein
VRRPRPAALAATAAALLAFAGTLAYGFVWDDTLLVERSYLLHDWRALPALLASQLWAEAGEASHYYRPLVTLSLFADVQLWGGAPAGFHLSNVLLHLGATLGVLAVARRVLGGELPAGLAAVLFAVHPVHTESVAFVSGRSDVLATLGVTLAFAAYVDWRVSGRAAARWRSLAAFALALAAKEVAVVLPLLLAALDRQRGALPGDRRALSAALRYWPWLAVLAAYLAVRLAVLGRLADAPGQAWATLPIRLLSALDTAGWYLRVALVPFPPAPYPVLVPATWPPAPVVWAHLALLAGGLVATASATRRSPQPALGAWWFWLALAPAVGVNLLPAPTTVMGERFLYLPSVGLCLVAGGLLGQWLGDPRQLLAGPARPAALGAAALVAGALVLTLWRNEDWRDNVSLYSRMVETSPRADLPRVNLAFALLPLGEVAAAHESLAEAARLAPSNPRAWAGLALTAALRGDRPGSRQHAERALMLAPASAPVLATLGSAALVRGEPEAAVAVLARSVELQPHQVHATLNLALAQARAGDHAQAEATLARARSLVAVMAPGLPQADAVAAEVQARRTEGGRR